LGLPLGLPSALDFRRLTLRRSTYGVARVYSLPQTIAPFEMNPTLKTRQIFAQHHDKSERIFISAPPRLFPLRNDVRL
jgi:hypothetical protein